MSIDFKIKFGLKIGKDRIAAGLDRLENVQWAFEPEQFTELHNRRRRVEGAVN